MKTNGVHVDEKIREALTAGQIDPEKLDEHRAKIGKAMEPTLPDAAKEDAGLVKSDGGSALYLVTGYGVFIDSETPVAVAFDHRTATVLGSALYASTVGASVPIIRPVRISRLSWRA